MHHFNNSQTIYPDYAKKRTKVTTGRPPIRVTRNRARNFFLLLLLFLMSNFAFSQTSIATDRSIHIPGEYLSNATCGNLAILSVYDLAGTLLLKQKFINTGNNQSHPLALNENRSLGYFSNGIYICTIDVNGERLIRKFVLNKP